MTTIEVLEKTLAEITPQNWHGGAPIRDGKCLCLGGHLSRQAGDACETPWRPGHPAMLAVARVIEPECQMLIGGVVANFNEKATFKQITTLLKRTIRAEKAKAGVSIDLPEVQEKAEARA